jgi:peptide chain release factor 3
LTEGEDLVFRGVPSFAPEILRRVKIGDAMKAKKLREALGQMAEEGVVQLFLPNDGSGAIVGVVGALQLDVLGERLAAEYGLDAGFESSRFETCRWITAKNPAELEKFIRAHPSSMAADLDGAPVFMGSSAWDLRYEQDKWPEVSFSDVKDYQKAAE